MDRHGFGQGPFAVGRVGAFPHFILLPCWDHSPIFQAHLYRDSKPQCLGLQPGSFLDRSMPQGSFGPEEPVYFGTSKWLSDPPCDIRNLDSLWTDAPIKRSCLSRSAAYLRRSPAFRSLPVALHL